MVLSVATTLAPQLASQSGDVADQLIPGSGWFKTMLRSAHVIHFYFSCIANYELATNRTTEFGIGATLYGVAGNNTILREIARFTAAAKLFTKCMKDGAKISKATTKLSNSIRSVFPLPTHYLKQKGTLDRANPSARQHLASNFSFLPESALTVILKTEQITNNTLKVLKESLFFLPNLLEVGQLLAFDDPQMNAIINLPANITDLINEWSSSKEALSSEIEKNRDGFGALLQATHSRYSVEEVYKFVADKDLPGRINRTIGAIKNVASDIGATLTYAASGTMIAPAVPSTRRIRSIPLNAKYCYANNNFTDPTCPKGK